MDQSFAALAACGLVALAVFQGVTTDWQVRTLSASQVPAIVAQHQHARFEVFEYLDGSRKLWISDQHAPDFIAPANEFTLGALARQDIPYQTYVAGKAGVQRPGRSGSILWMLALTAGASGLLGWALKSRPTSPVRIQNSGAI